MIFKKCGSVVDGDEPDYQGEGHDCPNHATRRSDVYESFSVYVRDVDHEGLEPWMDDDIHDLPEAAEARAANPARRPTKRVTKLSHLLDLYTTIDRLSFTSGRLWAWRVTDTGRR